MKVLLEFGACVCVTHMGIAAFGDANWTGIFSDAAVYLRELGLGRLGGAHESGSRGLVVPSKVDNIDGAEEVLLGRVLPN